MKPNFDKQDGLLPAVIQDSETGKVLMLGYMNREAFEKTQAEGRVTFFSRRKQRLWTKGEISGHYLQVKEIRLDCDQDTLLIKTAPQGPVCHTGKDTCFAEVNRDRQPFIYQLEKVIAERKRNPKSGSYTNKLLDKGPAKIAQKVGEEAVEVIIEAMAGDNDKLIEESADLLYHWLVLLSLKGVEMDAVFERLRQRRREQNPV